MKLSKVDRLESQLLLKLTILPYDYHINLSIIIHQITQYNTKFLKQFLNTISNLNQQLKNINTEKSQAPITIRIPLIKTYRALKRSQQATFERNDRSARVTRFICLIRAARDTRTTEKKII